MTTTPGRVQVPGLNLQQEIGSSISYSKKPPTSVLSDYDSSVLCVCYPQILPPEIYNILWDQILRACYHTLLDGFSAVRKCTNEGRALMQLDFRHFQVKVESLTRLRPLPDPHIVETYIKAYYLPENSFEKWIQEQTEYTPRQMMNLLQYVPLAMAGCHWHSLLY
ncbi:hypothetical protein OUZ56_017197 [Daphnia magna]|uniref:Syndetin C-terminal domain-containing protein n=1 Tax=Daphnia magna TaxID=35525 RepID=A0ABR0ASF9_9CRUS|nr:hypothetical protein OUZ56_017197 [Daphnia magna]